MTASEKSKSTRMNINNSQLFCKTFYAWVITISGNMCNPDSFSTLIGQRERETERWNTQNLLHIPKVAQQLDYLEQGRQDNNQLITFTSVSVFPGKPHTIKWIIPGWSHWSKPLALYHIELRICKTQSARKRKPKEQGERRETNRVTS